MSVEYRLLKEISFMEAGTVFKVYDVVDDKRIFCVEQFCEVEPKVFNPYENGILRSILEQTAWVERLAIINKPKEYRLLQSLPFLPSESVFIEYTPNATTMEYYTDGDDGESARLFSTHENAMLRSIIDNDDWVE